MKTVLVHITGLCIALTWYFLFIISVCRDLKDYKWTFTGPVNSNSNVKLAFISYFWHIYFLMLLVEWYQSEPAFQGNIYFQCNVEKNYIFYITVAIILMIYLFCFFFSLSFFFLGNNMCSNRHVNLQKNFLMIGGSSWYI